MSTKKRKANFVSNNNNFVNLLKSFEVENEKTPEHLLQLNEDFNELVSEYNFKKDQDISAVLEIEKKMRDKICLLNQMKLLDEQLIEIKRLLLFIFMDFQGHIIRELDSIDERSIII